MMTEERETKGNKRVSLLRGTEKQSQHHQLTEREREREEERNREAAHG